MPIPSRQTRRFDRDPDWRAAAARLEQLRDRVLKELEAGQKPQARQAAVMAEAANKCKGWAG